MGKVAILHFPHRAARCAIGDESVVTYIASDEVEAGPEGSAEENDQRRQAKQKREDRENGAAFELLPGAIGTVPGRLL